MTLVFFFHWLRASTQPLGDLASYFSPTKSIDTTSRLPSFPFHTDYRYRADLYPGATDLNYKRSAICFTNSRLRFLN